jgi:short-subunit dehydrogenase
MLHDKFDTKNIDFLIYNAGFGKAIPIEKLTENDFDSFVNVHLKGVPTFTAWSIPERAPIRLRAALR